MDNLILKFSKISLLISAGLVILSCSKTEIPRNENLLEEIETRVEDLNKDWTCPSCRTKNFEWRSVCIVCGEKYNKAHGNYIESVWQIIIGGGGFISEIDGLKPTEVGKRVQLPNGNFPSIEPEPWFENAGALKYYNELQSSFAYRFTPDYAAGADYAWYHTTHILYPKYLDKTQVERLYTKWELNEARNLKGDIGKGIKDGTKAAVTAYINR